MKLLDTYWDTKDKRYHLFWVLTLIMVVCIIIPYILLGVACLRLETYDDVFALLKTPIIEMTYLSRVILDVISMSNISCITIAHVVISNLHPIEVCAAILLCMAYPHLERNKRFTIGLLIYITEILGCGICVMLGLQSPSLQTAMHYVKVIGALLTVINSLFVCVAIYYLWKQCGYYKTALQYTVIEIKEHKSELP